MRRRRRRKRRRLRAHSHPDLADSGQGVGAQLVHDRQQHLVTGDLAKMDPGGEGEERDPCTPSEAEPKQPGSRRAERHLPEEEEEAAAEQLHLQTLLDEGVEEPQQLRNVGEGEDQQGDFQLAEGSTHTAYTHTLPTHTHTHEERC